MTDPGSPSPPPRSPAAWSTEGACGLLSQEKVVTAFRTQFDVAVASAQAGAQACVLQVRGAKYPDFTLSLAPTKVDAAGFPSKITPNGGKAVAGVGAAAYSLVSQTAADAGPGAEIGWLGKGATLVTVRYTFPPGTAGGAATALLPALTDFAKQLEAART